MNTAQKALVTLLSASIHKNEVDLSYLSELDWNEVYEEADAHAVLPLVFPTVKKISSSCKINKDLINKWANNTIMNAICQTQHINQMKIVFKAFEESGIPFIALKGLILRDLYTNPEFRTMSDSDILIKKEYSEQAEKLLTNLGYSKYGSISYESCFTHPNALSIDLHWSLTDESHLKDVYHFENTVWQNLRTYNFNGINVQALSLEYELMHLFVHIASHMIKSGFGLRQLCDIVVFLDKNSTKIDWDLIYNLADKCKLNKLINIILYLCHSLFDLDLPSTYNKTYDQSNKYIQILINEVFQSGVYGKRDNIRISSTRLLSNTLKVHEDTNKFKVILRYLFPSIHSLDKRYSYASKYHFLLIFAWVHRLFYELIFNLSKLKELFKIGSISSLVQSRYDLIKWLQLRQ